LLEDQIKQFDDRERTLQNAINELRKRLTSAKQELSIVSKTKAHMIRLSKTIEKRTSIITDEKATADESPIETTEIHWKNANEE